MYPRRITATILFKISPRNFAGVSTRRVTLNPMNTLRSYLHAMISLSQIQRNTHTHTQGNNARNGRKGCELAQEKKIQKNKQKIKKTIILFYMTAYLDKPKIKPQRTRGHLK